MGFVDIPEKIKQIDEAENDNTKVESPTE